MQMLPAGIAIFTAELCCELVMLGKRILKAVRAYRNREDGRLTASIGIAVLARHETAAVTWAELVKAADQQLYLAKRNGRDQCRCVIFAAEQKHEQAGVAPRLSAG